MTRRDEREVWRKSRQEDTNRVERESEANSLSEPGESDSWRELSHEGEMKGRKEGGRKNKERKEKEGGTERKEGHDSATLSYWISSVAGQCLSKSHPHSGQYARLVDKPIQDEKTHWWGF